MKMPASTVDLVGAALKTSLAKSEDGSPNLDLQIAASNKKALLNTIDFELSENYQMSILDNLKSKYLVLTNSEHHYQQIQNHRTKLELNNRALQSPKDNDLPVKAKQELWPMERIQLGWSNSKEWSVGAGMVNMGNTCYMNSTLQALFHVPSLVNWLISDKEHMAQCEDNGVCIICAMRKTLQESQQRNVTSIRPILIYNKLRLVCRNLVPGRQEDAHEFLRYLIEAMEKAYLQRFKNHSQFDSKVKETTPLNQILGGYLRSSVRCLKCGHVSTTIQHFQDLLLDIRKAQTLDEALEMYFSREKLDDESYHCEACQKKVQATKQFQVERAPMALCIQLKRFSVSNNKITKHIAFRNRLDLSRYARQKPQVPLVYRLVALVTHMGPTVNCGHYTAVGQAPSGNFYQFDDSMVRPISHQSVFNTNAYIMLYELESTAHIPRPTIQLSLKSKVSSTITEPSSCSKVVLTLRPNNNHNVNKGSENGTLNSTMTSLAAVGFTSDKVYGPELPPERLNVSSSTSSNGNMKTKAVSSTSSSLSTALTDDSATESSDDEMQDAKASSSPNLSKKEADSSTANDDSPTEVGVEGGSPDSSSSVVSTSISSLSSPETIKKASVSPSKSLVPYETGDTSGSEDSNHSETNNRVQTKATMGEWQVTSSTDVETPSTTRQDSKKKLSRTASRNVVNQLFKMSTSGYSAPVSTWSGTTSQLDREVQEERRAERKRAAADTSDDQPRTKHAKVSSSFVRNKSSQSNPGYNPVQEYHNMKNWSNANGSSSMNNYHHNKPFYRPKRNFGHHSGNKGGGGSFHKNNYRFR